MNNLIASQSVRGFVDFHCKFQLKFLQIWVITWSCISGSKYHWTEHKFWGCFIQCLILPSKLQNVDVYSVVLSVEIKTQFRKCTRHSICLWCYSVCRRIVQCHKYVLFIFLSKRIFHILFRVFFKFY